MINHKEVSLFTAGRCIFIFIQFVLALSLSWQRKKFVFVFAFCYREKRETGNDWI